MALPRLIKTVAVLRNCRKVESVGGFPAAIGIGEVNNFRFDVDKNLAEQVDKTMLGWVVRPHSKQSASMQLVRNEL